MYLNKGNMQFEDVTASAGVGNGKWCKGKCSDINNDGLMDIYVRWRNEYGLAKKKPAVYK